MRWPACGQQEKEEGEGPAHASISAACCFQSLHAATFMSKEAENLDNSWQCMFEDGTTTLSRLNAASECGELC